MMTSSSIKDVDRMIPVRVDYSKARQKYAKGGLAKSAESVRSAGRMGDDMVVHVNKREFDEMRRRWGDPTINPDTNLPEFFLGDLFGGVGDLVTDGASYIPGVGSDLSGWLASNPGAAQAIGSGLLGAGVGQLFGGNTKSTLLGAGLGAIAPSFLGGAGLFGGAVNPTPPGGGLPDSDNVFKIGLEESGVKPGTSGLGGLLSGANSNQKTMAAVIGALTLANAIGGNKGPNKAQKQAAARDQAAQDQFNRRIPSVPFNRQMTPFNGDPRTYGFGGQNFGGWFSGNSAPLNQPNAPKAPTLQQIADDNGQRYARGGDVECRPMVGGLAAAMPSERFVRGPGGAREDKIPALLSNNEYVLTAEEMALLGDGDPEMGAKKMDEMRANLRRHKGGALSRGKISPDAKPADGYLPR